MKKIYCLKEFNNGAQYWSKYFSTAQKAKNYAYRDFRTFQTGGLYWVKERDRLVSTTDTLHMKYTISEYILDEK